MHIKPTAARLPGCLCHFFLLVLQGGNDIDGLSSWCNAAIVHAGHLVGMEVHEMLCCCRAKASGSMSMQREPETFHALIDQLNSHEKIARAACHRVGKVHDGASSIHELDHMGVPAACVLRRMYTTCYARYLASSSVHDGCTGVKSAR